MLPSYLFSVFVFVIQSMSTITLSFYSLYALMYGNLKVEAWKFAREIKTALSSTWQLNMLPNKKTCSMLLLCTQPSFSLEQGTMWSVQDVPAMDTAYLWVRNEGECFSFNLNPNLKAFYFVTSPSVTHLNILGGFYHLL